MSRSREIKRAKQPGNADQRGLVSPVPGGWPVGNARGHYSGRNLDQAKHAPRQRAGSLRPHRQKKAA